MYGQGHQAESDEEEALVVITTFQTRPDTLLKMHLACVLFTFENKTGHTDGRTDGQTNGRTDGHDLL